MCEDLEAPIRFAADEAKNLLGQLGPLVWALHGAREAVGDEASRIASDPQENLRTDPRVDPTRCIQRRAAADICALLSDTDRECAPQILSSRGFREVINRSIVVYAVALLEQFLDKAGKPAFICRGGNEADWRESFGSRCKSLCQVGLSLYCSQHYAESALFALLRHKAVHKDGKADSRFPCQVSGIERQSNSQLLFRLSEKGDSIVWDASGTSGQRFRCEWIGKHLSLAIDEVILPLLRDAEAFVEEAACLLRKHTRVAETDARQGGACE